MWIRNQQRDRLIDVSDINIQTISKKSKEYEKKFNEIYDELQKQDLYRNHYKSRYFINPVDDITNLKADSTTLLLLGDKAYDYSYKLVHNGITLATYPTKERCLEVLEEIQANLSANLSAAIVYEMPHD